MNTKSVRKEDVEHSWYLLDAEDQILGRFATFVANKLRGKDKPTFTPHVDNGDFIVVVNAAKIKLLVINLNKRNIIIIPFIPEV